MNMRERLRTALPGAMKQRDAGLVAVLRATLAALDNAEAVPPQEHDHGSLALEATPVGVGVREVARRDLSDEEVERLVRAEIDERRTAARVYEQAGEHEHARRLRHEADTLAAVADLPHASDAPAADR
jgi:uncharacterized protein YqeY